MAAAYTPEQLAMLEAQVAHFASDDHIRREVAMWRDSSPVERLAEMAEMCATSEHFLSRLPVAQQDRIATREPLPADSLAVLAAIRASTR